MDCLAGVGRGRYAQCHRRYRPAARAPEVAYPLSLLVLANALVAVVGVPWMFAAMPDPMSWGLLLIAGVVQLGLPLVLYGKAIPHVRAIEAVLIPILEPVLNPMWVLVFVG